MPDSALGLIRLDVEVMDKAGSPVTDLTQEDFALEDNGQPGTVVSLQALHRKPPVADLSLEVILVIDALNLDGAQIRTAEGEAEAFLRLNQGRLAQPVMVYRVTRLGPLTAGPPSLDGNRLADEIAHRSQTFPVWDSRNAGEYLHLSAGSTPVLQNISNSLTSLGAIAIQERRRPGRKLLFWLSPGWRTNGIMGSGLFDQFTELSTRMREARISLWAASQRTFLNDGAPPAPDFIDPAYLRGALPQTREVAYLGLPVLAAQNGGGVLPPGTELHVAIGTRAEQAGEFYSLTFDPQPTEQVDAYHSLHVGVRRPGLTVRAATGYFDEPVFYDQADARLQRVTVAQLEQTVHASATTSDTELARRLSAMQLTERLSSPHLAVFEAALRGKRSRQALVALADQSIYLAPPVAEIVAVAPPEAVSRQHMIAQAIEYVNQALPRLPNFQAERSTVLYQQDEPKKGQTWKTAAGDRTLKVGARARASVVFRRGKEVATAEGGAGKQPERLKTIGTFGPVLAVAMAGATAPRSNLTWTRWEQGTTGLTAVFTYQARPAKPLYATGAEYLARDDTTIPFLASEPFHGEIAIDAESGAILRLTVQADLPLRFPLDVSNIMVEYGPVVMGGHAYICPLRAVSVSRQRRFMALTQWGEEYKVYAPFETLMNDMALTTIVFFNLQRICCRALRR